jgi:hypothetical protein
MSQVNSNYSTVLGIKDETPKDLSFTKYKLL